MARHRPPVPILALTADERVQRRLALVWGVTAITVGWYAGGDELLGAFRDSVRATGLVPEGSRIVVTAGWPLGRGMETNLVHVTTL